MAKVGASTPEFPLTSWFYNGYFIAGTGNVITATVNKYWKSYKASNDYREFHDYPHPLPTVTFEELTPKTHS